MKSENFWTFVSYKINPVIAMMTSQRSDCNLVFFLVKAVQFGDEFCLDPLGAGRADGKHLGLYNNCRAKKKQLIFPSAGNLILVFRNYPFLLSEFIISLTKTYCHFTEEKLLDP